MARAGRVARTMARIHRVFVFFLFIMLIAASRLVPSVIPHLDNARHMPEPGARKYE
jgi:hypothetical protein